MENASKALLMSAGILIGVLILSLAAYLFYVYGQYSADTVARIDERQITQFNNQFLKYYGTTIVEDVSTGRVIEQPILCTAHDIISLSNIAKQINENLEIENLGTYDENTRYVQIDVLKPRMYNVELASDEDKTTFIQNNDLVDVIRGDSIEPSLQTKYFKCVNVEISNVTKRVNHVVFTELTEDEYKNLTNN